MPGPMMSASQLGALVGVTPQVLNRLFQDQDILVGGPGAYALSPKGTEFGIQVHHDNGYGGVAYRAWETTHFDPAVMQVIDTSPKGLRRPLRR